MFSVNRFATAELVHSIKIISDNQQSPTSKISAKKVTQLIEKSLSKILFLANQLENLADELLTNIDISDEFELFLQSWHFSQYQKIRLEKTLRRWKILSPEINAFESIHAKSISATAILQHLNQSLDKAQLHFGKENDV
jgi:hypothetical protein